ncbi:MAG: calcium-binding protein [Microcystis sp. M048S1]|nr:MULTISPECIES: calcium-binding protein [unclassified Microcystis]MCA2724128.1 calcium-binding protein [Microcystis sp. M176S2]MCA2780011.1 calcium-binding protein [Microcystis sp. M136S2]MCA2782701.1 calcium-binding protein [Microcystis sp. M125S2]MCA2792808.1 calcium-binding protein [Microcystis sp. M112S2]MCA2895375.1 calcium-binding protein [Microcystis sp. M048S1]
MAIITGTNGNDILIGTLDIDIMDGGLGADTMYGSNGNDTYYVDNVGDIVQEFSDGALGGTADLVLASVSYSLAPGTLGNQGYGIENLLLMGSAINATGNDKNNILWGNIGNNVLNGGFGNDTLYGSAGNDTLDGGVGVDSMDGGDGNDTYYVDNVGDIVQEFYDNSLGGTADTVWASVTYSLAPGIPGNQGYGIENLFLTGSANINATGNDKNNFLLGNSGNNVLNGGLGNDTLFGGVGVDTLFGGDGNDTYYVDNVGDIVQEFSDNSLGGTDDTVLASVSYSLAPGTPGNRGYGIENLTLTESANINATGNDKNNILLGNSGNNVLNGVLGNDTLFGGVGVDTLFGGDGNDTYYVDNVGDIVQEFSDNSLGGTADTVLASVSYSLAPGTPGNRGYGIENLTLTESANIDATGNDKNNILWGNIGNNVLNGGLGLDTLTGGAGNDSFRLGNVANRDLITDFSVPADTIILANSLDSTLAGSFNPGIKGLSFISGNVNGSVLNSAQFFKGAGSTGGASGNLSGIYVNTSNGDIWYNDSNLVGSYLIANVGAGAAAGMTNADFVYWA